MKNKPRCIICSLEETAMVKATVWLFQGDEDLTKPIRKEKESYHLIRKSCSSFTFISIILFLHYEKFYPIKSANADNERMYTWREKFSLGENISSRSSKVWLLNPRKIKISKVDSANKKVFCKCLIPYWQRWIKIILKIPTFVPLNRINMRGWRMTPT